MFTLFLLVVFVSFDLGYLQSRTASRAHCRTSKLTMTRNAVSYPHRAHFLVAFHDVLTYQRLESTSLKGIKHPFSSPNFDSTLFTILTHLHALYQRSS